jgi:hypothetical protein
MPPLHRLPLGRFADSSPQLFPREFYAHGSDSAFTLSMRHQRFIFIHLLNSHLPAFQQLLTTKIF